MTPAASEFRRRFQLELARRDCFERGTMPFDTSYILGRLRCGSIIVTKRPDGYSSHITAPERETSLGRYPALRDALEIPLVSEESTTVRQDLQQLISRARAAGWDDDTLFGVA